MRTGERITYRGKHFDIPTLNPGIAIVPHNHPTWEDKPRLLQNLMGFEQVCVPIIKDFNTIWDLEKFKVPRKPYPLGAGKTLLTDEGQAEFSKPGAVNVLDLPIKFPGSDFRLPKELLQFANIVDRVANFEAQYNECYDEYYCYMSVDQRPVKAGNLQREAPCHVDGFQGSKWNPKVKINHTYVISDKVPTTYYVQPFNFDALDEAKHNFFWEMNRQVALTDSKHAWQPECYELNMIDAYTVHRGTPAQEDCFRTWLRLSFEVRIFNRLGNAHNPMFQYDWNMEPRDIEGLNLVAYDVDSDPSLRVFPWQKLDGTPHEDRHTKTQPSLRPIGEK